MSNALRYVRPVMSLDAAPMKTTTAGGGTLYMASVRSASNDVFPVAISLMVDNENKDGWQWFLQNLKSSLPLLEEAHPKAKVGYKLFTFISDQKIGLVDALQDVFPGNHSCFCAAHIARNVEERFGAKHSRYVLPLAKTFSSAYAEELLQLMGEQARNYVQQIEPQQWRSTAWLQDEGLPPRYGIVMSNVSESPDSIFDKARDVPWKSSVHIILTEIVIQVAKLSAEYRHKSGVIHNVLDHLTHCWESCEGMSIVPMNGDQSEDIVTVFEPVRGSLSEEATGYTMNVSTQACDCGLWQEHGYPCMHAVAFFKKHRNYSFDNLLAEVSKEYTYENECKIFERNFLSVCIQRVAPDKTILAPLFTKRKAGRPRKRMKMA
jgi:MULE transposase domain/SWIM zinc finger